MNEILLMDFDGVLRLWPDDVDRRIESAAGLPVGAIARAAFTMDVLGPAITGQCSDEMWRDAIAVKLTELTDAETAAETVRRWSASRGELNESCLQLLETVRPEVGVALVTNATSRLDDDLRALGIRQRFSAVFNSFDLGVAKPDRRFFETVLKRLGVKPDSCFFIDDSPSHVNTARQLGIKSHHFDGVDGTRAFLESSGVLVN